MITFEYDDKGLINKVLLRNGDTEVTHFRTYMYDDNGNVKEENFYSYLFIPEGTGPKHLWKTTFEYDSYFNPYKIFAQSGYPGLNTNLNNVTKSQTTNYDPAPGLQAISTSETSYEYNGRTRFPIRVINGEEFIYQ
jgi:YD repeat-containing protein